jgi:CRISPR-associated protein (TIGR02584 family)
MTPKEFPRRILLAVTGMSPQVVTETLYALVNEQDFAPTEIRLITTMLGRNRVERDLLDARDGQFHAFCREYGLVGKIHFDTSCIKVICDEQGAPLPDIRTPEENSRAADEIASVVQTLCRDEMAALHVSIAGGRKSMGFFLGYALSLFARPQDRLSHVLVSEPFESNRDFFFPSRAPKELVAADGQKLDASTASVMLAGIPLVRLRSGLPQELLVGRTSYSAAVAAAQAGIAPEIELAFNFPQREIVCGGQVVKLAPMLFALVLWLARLRVAGRAVRPGLDADAGEFLAVYCEVVTSWSADYQNAEQSLRQAEDFLPKFQELRSRLKTRLERKLGPLAGPYLIEASGKPTQTRYQLVLPPDLIRL